MTAREMSLGKRQRLFTKCVGELIQHAYAQGYELTFGDAYRDPRVHGEWGEKKGYSSKHSCHKMRLAVDLNLFVGGVYQPDSRAHEPLGKWWEALGEKCGLPLAWGGMSDGNHYSCRHQNYW